MEKGYAGFQQLPKRIEWIDMAKGITILLVIIGHTVSEGFYEGIVRGLIFFFHMPLFFILSCATYKLSLTWEDFWVKTKKSARYLLTPVAFTFFLDTFFQCLKSPELCFNSLEFWQGKLFTMIFASGVSLTYNGFEISSLGIPWFFFALFLGRSIFDYVHLAMKEEPKVILCCSLIGMIGVLYGRIQWLPFSLDIALAVMPLFYFGYIMKSIITPQGSIRKLFVWYVIWIGTLLLSFTDEWTYMELAVRRYTLFPICYITAIAGTMTVCELGMILCKIKVCAKPLLYIGRNSIYILCVHIMDSYWWKLWEENQQFYSAIKRVAIDILIFLFIMFVKKIYKDLNNKEVVY